MNTALAAIFIALYSNTIQAAQDTFKTCRLKHAKKCIHKPQSSVFWERKNLERLSTILPPLFPCSLIAFINSVCPYTHFKDFVAMGIYFHILLSLRKTRFGWLNVTEALTFVQPNQIYSLKKKKKSVYVFESLTVLIIKRYICSTWHLNTKHKNSLSLLPKPSG